MSHIALVLVVLAALVSVVQWAWGRVAVRVDPQLMPLGSRRHVERVLANATRVQLAAVGVAACAAFAQALAMLS